MDFYPIFTKLDNKTVLLVGGGEVAYRKALGLVRASARIKVVAPQVYTQFAELMTEHHIEWHQRPFESGDLNEVDLVITATEDAAVNTQVFELATERHLFVNAVDDLNNCSFIVPALVDRSPLTVAISSGGASPVLVRRIKQQLDVMLPSWLGRLTELVKGFRQEAKQKIKTVEQRRYFWEQVFDGSVARLAAKEQWDQAETQIQGLLDGQKTDAIGEVYIVGAGPGDPELLTIKALQKMQAADVVVYDFLVSQDILDMARKDAEFICVGKRAGHHTVPQEEINQLLVNKALTGSKVCRLKGGDPFIYGRGGEEAELLVEHGVPFEVVPGVTAAAGCAAYAGIPLTHRDHAQMVQIITGHCKPGGNEPDWKALASPYQTLIVYMGVIRGGYISEQLMKHGMSGTMPVAIIESGTRVDQRVATGTLENLQQLIDESQIGSPALMIIGTVVSLRQALNWWK